MPDLIRQPFFTHLNSIDGESPHFFKLFSAERGIRSNGRQGDVYHFCIHPYTLQTTLLQLLLLQTPKTFPFLLVPQRRGNTSDPVLLVTNHSEIGPRQPYTGRKRPDHQTS